MCKHVMHNYTEHQLYNYHFAYICYVVTDIVNILSLVDKLLNIMVLILKT